MEVSAQKPALYIAQSSDAPARFARSQQTAGLSQKPSGTPTVTAQQDFAKSTASTVALSPEAAALAGAERGKDKTAATAGAGASMAIEQATDNTGRLSEVESPNSETSQGKEIPGASEPAASIATSSHAGESGKQGVEVPLHDAKVFAYGALGIEHPDDRSHPKDTFYTAGKWVSAAVTLGTIVSLLV